MKQHRNIDNIDKNDGINLTEEEYNLACQPGNSDLINSVFDELLRKNTTIKSDYTNKIIQELDDKKVRPEALNYILNINGDYYHNSILCDSSKDMYDKASVLEKQWGPMQLEIKVKKKKLIITNVLKTNTDCGILFNPPLVKQLANLKQSSLNEKTIELLMDEPDDVKDIERRSKIINERANPGIDEKKKTAFWPTQDKINEY